MLTMKKTRKVTWKPFFVIVNVSQVLILLANRRKQKSHFGKFTIKAKHNKLNKVLYCALFWKNFRHRNHNLSFVLIHWQMLSQI